MEWPLGIARDPRLAVPGPACPWACGRGRVVVRRRVSASCGRARPVLGWLRLAGFWGLPVTRRETARSIPIAADPRRRLRREAPHPVASGRRLPLTRTVHRDATTVGRDRRGSAPRPGACVLSDQCSRTRSAIAERVLRTASRSHGESGWPCFSPSWSKSINSSSVVAPVVMWSGRRAVQVRVSAARPSPGRHVHGRVVRGARGGASSGRRRSSRRGGLASPRVR